MIESLDSGLVDAVFAIFAIRMVCEFKRLGTRKERAFMLLCQNIVYTTWNILLVGEAKYWASFFLLLGIVGTVLSYRLWKNTDDDDDDKRKKARRGAGNKKIAKPVTQVIPRPI